MSQSEPLSGWAGGPNVRQTSADTLVGETGTPVNVSTSIEPGPATPSLWAILLKFRDCAGYVVVPPFSDTGPRFEQAFWFAPTAKEMSSGAPHVQFVPTVQSLLTVPALAIAAVSAVRGLLVFILTTRSTGRVDHVWPKETEQGKETKERARSNEDIITNKARFRITSMPPPTGATIPGHNCACAAGATSRTDADLTGLSTRVAAFFPQQEGICPRASVGNHVAPMTPISAHMPK